MKTGPNILRKIEVEEFNNEILDISFYFVGSSKPFSAGEFEPNTKTHAFLHFMEAAIKLFNIEEERSHAVDDH